MAITTHLTVTRPEAVVVTIELSATDIRVSYEDPENPDAALATATVTIGEGSTIHLNLTPGTPVPK